MSTVPASSTRRPPRFVPPVAPAVPTAEGAVGEGAGASTGSTEGRGTRRTEARRTGDVESKGRARAAGRSTSPPAEAPPAAEASVPGQNVVSPPTSLTLLAGVWDSEGIPGRPLQQVSWGSSRSGTPNAIARSTLFAGNDRPDEYAEDVVLYAQAGYSMKFTGKPLTSYHSLVWQAAVRIMMRAGKQAGDMVFFSKSDIVHEMGWASDGGANLEWAWNALRRLSRSHVEISSRHLDYTGPLLYWVGRSKDDEGPSRFAMVMNPTMVQLFCEDITVIDFERKRELRSDIAMWLHDYLSSHHENRPIAIKELVKLSGHTHLPLFKFRSRLKDAAQRLVAHQRPLLRSFSINEQDEFVYEKAEGTFVIGRPSAAVMAVPDAPTRSAALASTTASTKATGDTAVRKRASRSRTVPVATTDGPGTNRSAGASSTVARSPHRASDGPDRRSPAERAAAAQRARVAL